MATGHSIMENAFDNLRIIVQDVIILYYIGYLVMNLVLMFMRNAAGNSFLAVSTLLLMSTMEAAYNGCTHMSSFCPYIYKGSQYSISSGSVLKMLYDSQ